MSFDAHALLTIAQIRAADEAAIAAGTPGSRLMEAAGRAVADAASRRLRPGASVLVLCGPGANGGDGFVAARLLRERGQRVTLMLAGERWNLTGDAAEAAARWPEPARPLDASALGAPDLIVDALFGAGLSRPLDGEVAAVVAALNASGRPVLAVDVPTGVDGDSGQVLGSAVRAVETVTFFRLKPAHCLYPGRGLCGVVSLADIGIAWNVAAPCWSEPPTLFRNGPDIWRAVLPRMAPDTHKFRRGAVLVLAGGLEGVGAPRLSARAALRAGAGLATLACRPEALAAHAARGPDALMVRAIPDEPALNALLSEPRLAAVVAGPALGLDGTAAAVVEAVLRAKVPAVLDADALTLLAGEPERLRHRPAATVLTPHEGEFLRLFGDMGEGSARSKVERAREAARRSGCVVVLKGADTVIAEPEGRALVNATGSAALATAGSGDALAGVVAGLLAQGMPAYEAAAAAVWLHGRAGEALGAGLIADDLPEAVSRELRVSSGA